MLVVIDYKMGNVKSVAKAFDYIGTDVKISSQEKDIEKADYLVLPGVGAFKEGMKNLQALKLVDVLNRAVLENKKPILGICLGMQLMAQTSQEFGQSKGLGWLDADVLPFEFTDNSLKVPHVGWNNISFNPDAPLFKGIKEQSDFYFVHSFYMKNSVQNDVIAACSYGIEFTSVVNKENIFATQFHPEKSQRSGLKLLENFIEINSKK